MPKILKVALPVPLRKTFDYLPPENGQYDHLQIGARLTVPFGNQNKIGYLIEVTDESTVSPSRLKPIKDIIDEESLLSVRDLTFLRWASEYYHHPLGEVISSAFPVLLRKGKPSVLKRETVLMVIEDSKCDRFIAKTRAYRQVELLKIIKAAPQGVPTHELHQLDWNWRSCAKQLNNKGLIKFVETQRSILATNSSNASPLILNAAQTDAVDTVKNALGHFKPFLLEGVTGSGKTEVYLRVIDSVLQHKQVLVFLPEINLTPQLEKRFRARFNCPIAILHSGLTDYQRLQAWLRFRKGLAKILLGTRSAAFTPVKNPGLIIVDEEHDTSYKQQDGFRFSARDIAIARAKQLDIPILLGTATPSFESYLNVRRNRYHPLVLPDRAGGARLPQLKILDIRNQSLTEGMSPGLLKAMKTVMDRNEQVLLFLNRRGYAPTLICHACGWVAHCHRCDSNLVIHAGERKLRCHHCGYERHLINQCNGCQSIELQPLGLGTERVEQALKRSFPNSNIARIDRDSTKRKGSLEAFLKQVNDGSIDLLLGTQMLAKGHHFPRVTLVGILDVDGGLFSTDFRAAERMAQMITQVAGRAGREKKPGAVMLQTRHPEHPLLLSLTTKGYGHFAEQALTERKAASLPPFSHQALLRSEASQSQKPLSFLEAIRKLAVESGCRQVQIFGPIQAPLARREGFYRYQLLFQSPYRKHLHQLLTSIIPKILQLKDSSKVRWSVDIDPVDLY